MPIQYIDIDKQRISYLGYKLYSLGWRSGLHKRLPLHLLLSSFLYYRRGFVDASKWLEEDCLEENLR